jgi:hypothetical protein
MYNKLKQILYLVILIPPQQIILAPPLYVVLYPYKRKYENPRVIYPSYINFIIVQRKQILKVLFFNRCREEE